MGLRQIIGELRDWMANGRPPWAAYWVLMMGSLIGLSRCPSVRPVRVEETWHRLLAKVRVDGDGGGSQGGLQDGATLWWIGGRYQSRYSHGADPLEAA